MDFGIDVTHGDDTAVLSDTGADFVVRLVPAAAVLDEGRAVPVPGCRFVVAGDVPVGQVGSRYHPVQNAELLGFARRTAGSLGAAVERAGVTQGRRKFWCHVPVGTSGAGVILSTSHDGRGAVAAQMVVTGRAGLIRLGPEADSTLSFPHGPTLQARLDDPAEVAGWANSWELAARAEVERLRSKTLRPEVIVEALEGVVPTRKATTDRKRANRHAVLDAVAGRWVGYSTGRTDAWSLLEAVATYLDVDRRASRADREDQAVDDSGWVTRAKFLAHAAVTG